MSAEYIFLIDGQQYGPVSFADLKTMAANGQITDETHVRLSDESEWVPWRAERQGVEVVQKRETIIAEQQVSEPEQREAARIAADAQRRSAMSKNKEEQEKMPREQPRVVVRKLDLPEVRDKLRKLTAYPRLRIAMKGLLTLSALGIPACILVAFLDLEVGIVTAVACLGSVLSTLFLGVFLDIADALLAKLD